MTTKQFANKIKKLFRTQKEAAQALGVSRETVKSWKSGRRPIPGYAVKLLNCLEAQE